MRLMETDVDEAAARSVAGLEPGRYARLTVIDDGSGMSPDVLARAFEPFFTTKRSGGGSGLGLATVHGIVAAHDGAIALSSAPGAGTSVEVWLPSLPATAAIVEPLDPAGEEAIRGAGQHVLLVEDDPSVLALGRRALELLGYRVTATDRPIDAIERIEAAPEAFDLVLSDFSMPDWNGLQLARRVHAVAPTLPIVLVTACLNGAKLDELAEFGIVELIEKPWDQRTLAATLARALADAAASITA